MKYLLLLALCMPCFALERDYQDKYCDGRIEFVLPDRTRVDCLTSTHAIEYDHANKLYEGLGQALHYAAMTGKKAGVVLILHGKEDERYYHRLRSIIFYHKLYVDVWVVYADE